MRAVDTVDLVFPRIPLEIFTPILGMGVGIPVRVGVNLKEMLCGQLHMPPDYLENRIQTILLNGRPVDQVDRLLLADGDVIALSAAMPGLAGAILRKGGALSPMRAAISQKPSAGTGAADRKGVVILKLFNMVAKEMGPQVLAGGIWLRGKVWASILPDLPESHRSNAGIGADEWIALFISGKNG